MIAAAQQSVNATFHDQEVSNVKQFGSSSYDGWLWCCHNVKHTHSDRVWSWRVVASARCQSLWMNDSWRHASLTAKHWQQRAALWWPRLKSRPEFKTETHRRASWKFAKSNTPPPAGRSCGFLSLLIWTAPSLNSFKNRLDRFWFNQDILYNWHAELTKTDSRSIVSW